MAALQEYKCPCCGGAIAFDSSVQKMKCPYCDTEFDVETIRQQAEAVLLCQNAAETIKASGGLEEAANALDALEQESDFPMEVRETESNVPGLGQAEIRILSPETGEGLYSLTVGWQEVLP